MIIMCSEPPQKWTFWCDFMHIAIELQYVGNEAQHNKLYSEFCICN